MIDPFFSIKSKAFLSYIYDCGSIKICFFCYPYYIQAFSHACPNMCQTLVGDDNKPKKTLVPPI
jgi:hypothetical protein